LIIYADILFAINFSMDFLSLFICSLLTHSSFKRIRMIISSSIGGAYGVIGVIFENNILISFLCSLVIATIMVMVCFEVKKVKKIAVLTAILYFVSTMLGGIMSFLYSFMNKLLANYMRDNTYEKAYSSARICVIIGLTAIISIIFSRIITSKKDEKNVKITITIKDKEFTLMGFCDSGNLLTEPFSGKRVILVGGNSEIGRLIKNVEITKRKYIPYKDINGEGMLYGIKPNTVIINSSPKDAIVAVSNNDDFNGYDALVPSVLL